MDIAKKIRRLESKYRRLVEQAYNFKCTDPSLSDYYDFKANEVKSKLQFISRLSA